jgi:predicted DNA-binding transcriptional regulator AlpA
MFSTIATTTDTPPKLTSSTIPDFAARHGLAVSTVWQWIKDGRLHAARLGPRATRITAAEEARFLTESAKK